MRRLRVRPSQPNLRGPRETPPGPTTWVRPATGWWKRMNAGENPRNQGRRRVAPVRFQKAVLRSKEKRRGEAPIGAPVRVMGRLFPSAEGTGFAARLSHRVRRSAPALVGALPPRMGDIPQRRPGARSPETMALALLSGKLAARVRRPSLNRTTPHRNNGGQRFGETNPRSLHSTFSRRPV